MCAVHHYQNKVTAVETDKFQDKYLVQRTGRWKWMR